MTTEDETKRDLLVLPRDSVFVGLVLNLIS
jgi:hypothetical protein